MSSIRLAEASGQCWLSVVGGEHEGGRYPLHGDDLTLGRGTDNDLVLPDIAVSRKHLRLISTATGWHFRDLGSGNGTRLNGRVSDEGDLEDGDQIEVGNSVLEYLAVDRPPGKARSRSRRSSGPLRPAPADMESPLEGRKTQAADLRVYRKARSRTGARVALWAALAASVVLTLAVVTASWLTYRDSADSAGHSAGLTHYRRGATAFQRGDWEGSLREFRRASAADPTLADADRAVREIRAYRDVYRRGMQLGGKGRAPEARGLLSGIPGGAAFHPEARAALKALDVAEAAAAAPAPATKAPTAKPTPAAPAAAAGPADRAPTAGETPTSVTAAPGGGVPEAMARYREGQFDDAARILHAVAARGNAKAGKMAADVRAFSKAQKAGAASLNAGKTGPAVAQLEAALKLDEGLGRGYRSSVARQLAEALAQQAQDNLDDGKLKDAARTAVRARALVKDHRAAQQVLDKLVIKARELTLQAMKLRNPDPQAAMARLKTALKITPRKSAEHARAQDLLMKIEDSL